MYVHVVKLEAVLRAKQTGVKKESKPPFSALNVRVSTLQITICATGDNMPPHCGDMQYGDETVDILWIWNIPLYQCD